MGQSIDFSVLVHAQEGISYTRHDLIANIQKYLDPENSIHLVCEDYGNSLFKTSNSVKSDDTGYFNPEDITRFLKEKNLNPEELTKINITLLGGEFRRCLLKTFSIISRWEKFTPFLNRMSLFMPHDAVFDYERAITQEEKAITEIFNSPLLMKYGSEQSPLILSEMRNNPFLLADLSFYFAEFYGKTTILEEGIKFEYRKRPVGIFDSLGNLILKQDEDLYAFSLGR